MNAEQGKLSCEEEMKGVYSGTRVLVTGHTGFKGSWLSLWLHALGADVSGLALEPMLQPNLYDLVHVNEILNHDMRVDIRKQHDLKNAFKETRPEIVFHLAAQPLVQESYRDPVKTFETNVQGSVHVFEACRNVNSVRALVFVSTDKCYENKERIEGYREDESMGGYDPYSASKGAAEIVFSSYVRSFFKSERRVIAASGRAGNVIGGGDWSENRIVPDIVCALRRMEKISVRNPESVRPWQHVLEALSGYLTLGARLLQDDNNCFGGWNFGPEISSFKTVRELVDKSIHVWGNGNWEALTRSDDGHEAKLLSLNIEKAKTKLNWMPRWNFNQTVERTINWYKCYYDGVDARELCMADINAYVRSIEE